MNLWHTSDMTLTKTRNLHVPLPDALYQQLRQEAERQGQPATTLTRTALEAWLQQQEKTRLRQEFANFVQEHAGTELDLDTTLEASGIQHMLEKTEWKPEPKKPEPKKKANRATR